MVAARPAILLPVKVRTRIAPTPSGLLHLGNAWSFVMSWLAARATGGTVRLRIDDLDAARARDEWLDDIFASLRWLGIDWDHGPRDTADFKTSHSQRLRLARYHAGIDALRAGGHLYACTCTRSELRAAGAGAYPGTCRARDADAAPGQAALRFRVPQDAVHARDPDGGRSALHPARDMGDFVVRRRDGEPAYQLASVLDDTEHGINFVVRGLDLAPSTGAQLALAAALGLPDFSTVRFWHHPLLLDDADAKLSKSHGAESLAALRERFPDPAPVLRWFALRMGRSGEDARNVQTLRDLLPGFDVAELARRSGQPLRLAEFREFIARG